MEGKITLQPITYTLRTVKAAKNSTKRRISNLNAFFFKFFSLNRKERIGAANR